MLICVFRGIEIAKEFLSSLSGEYCVKENYRPTGRARQKDIHSR